MCEGNKLSKLYTRRYFRTMSTKTPLSTEQPHICSDKPGVKPADAELWHAYLRAISDYFPFSEKPDGYRIYTAPLTSFGVTIGRAIDPAIINNDLFRLGDLLLPPDSPVFLPRLSYSQRLRRYLKCAVVVIRPRRHYYWSLLISD